MLKKSIKISENSIKQTRTGESQIWKFKCEKKRYNKTNNLLIEIVNNLVKKLHWSLKPNISHPDWK